MKDQSSFPHTVVGFLSRHVPPPALTGFLILLMAMFAVSYEVGSAVGPVAPGMHSTPVGDGGGGRSEPHGHDMGDMCSGDGR
ncbi:hypothetical protein ACFCZT_26835 [Streptomyces sp. NPDC056230]|uniref:hypothetical protein n=1 Tax=Streptomyces sp. NPDC056230 TaxID=3345754 RepID=UPI0035DDC782